MKRNNVQVGFVLTVQSHTPYLRLGAGSLGKLRNLLVTVTVSTRPYDGHAPSLLALLPRNCLCTMLLGRPPCPADPPSHMHLNVVRCLTESENWTKVGCLHSLPGQAVLSADLIRHSKFEFCATKCTLRLCKMH